MNYPKWIQNIKDKKVKSQFEKWYSTKEEIEIDEYAFRKQDLRGVDFGDLILWNITFVGCDLRGVRFGAKFAPTFNQCFFTLRDVSNFMIEHSPEQISEFHHNYIDGYLQTIPPAVLSSERTVIITQQKMKVGCQTHDIDSWVKGRTGSQAEWEFDNQRTWLEPLLRKRQDKTVKKVAEGIKKPKPKAKAKPKLVKKTSAKKVTSKKKAA